MIWKVVVVVAEYQQPWADALSILMPREDPFGYVIVAPDRIEAELIACQMAARHGMPVYAETQYDW